MNRNVTATILLVLSIGIYMTFTRAKMAEINAVNTVNQEYVDALENAGKLVKIRDTVQEQYKNISEVNRTRLDKMLPNTVDNIRLTIDIDDLAKNRGLVLRNIKATASTASQKQVAAPSAVTAAPGMSRQNTGSIPTPTLDTVAVSFSTTATYQQFIDFLQSLESNLRIMDLMHLSVATTPSGLYEYSAEFRTYWLRQQ